jgi:uncharacterized protein
MAKRLNKLMLLTIFSFLFFSVQAQKVKNSKKSKAKEEIGKPPPPPAEEVIFDVRIDTSATEVEKPPPRAMFQKEDFFFNMPDTSAAPNDELTAELKKFLSMTGALDLGIQFAKLMNSDNEQERNGLPKEFYQKMYEEMATRETRAIFENEIIKVYRKYYTLADVKEILSFYATDAGKKMLKSLPSLMEESQKIGAEFGKVIGMKVYNDLIKEGKIN